MAAKTFYVVLFLVFCSKVESATLIERSYDYVMSLGKNIGPSLMSIMDCFGEDDVWKCTKEKAGKILENWEGEVDKQRRSWQEQADAEVMSSGRSLEEMPSKIGREVEESLYSISDLVQQGLARAFSRKHGSIDSVTVTTSNQKKKKQKKQKPAKVHVAAPSPGNVQSWVIGDNETGEGRNLVSDLWSMGEKALDAVAEHAIESDNAENGVEDKSSVEEQRGKKKKKKKAILKLLILGAVLKAKIGTILQILSFKLQVKFFIIALIGLGINLARFWLDVKKHHHSPQKVIYYEHAQHQHHYDHEDESGWGGPWSRSIEPEDEIEVDADLNSSPYRGQSPNLQLRPARA